MKDAIASIIAELIQPLVDAIDRNTAAVLGKPCAPSAPAVATPTDPEEAPAPKKRGPKPKVAEVAPELEPIPVETPVELPAMEVHPDPEPQQAPVAETPVQPEVSLQDVKTAAQTALAAGNKAAVIALLAQYEVSKITELPPARYADFHAELKKLA